MRKTIKNTIGPREIDEKFLLKSGVMDQKDFKQLLYAQAKTLIDYQVRLTFLFSSVNRDYFFIA